MKEARRERGIDRGRTPDLQGRLQAARQKLLRWLRQHTPLDRVRVPRCRLVVSPHLGDHALATHRPPNKIEVKSPRLPESVLFHELVHAAQQTQQTPRMFKLLYPMLAEGLADWITSQVYPGHTIKYRTECTLVGLLTEADGSAAADLLKINESVISHQDLENLLVDRRVIPYARKLLRDFEDGVRRSLRMAHEMMAMAHGWDVTLVTLGEEWAAWKFYVGRRFDGVRPRADRLLKVLYAAAGRKRLK